MICSIRTININARLILIRFTCKKENKKSEDFHPRFVGYPGFN